MLAALMWGAGFVLLIVVSAPINGLLISATWGWFIVPITGARQISIAEGIGLALFCSIMGTIATAHLKEWDFGEATGDFRTNCFKVIVTLVGVGIVGPIIGLGLAWIWHLVLM